MDPLKHRLCHLVAGASLMLAAGSGLPLQAQDVEAKVSEIREYYNYVQGIKKRQEVIKYEEDEGLFQATLTKHFSGMEVIQVTLRYAAADHYSAVEEYYYRQGQLVFAYVSRHAWVIDGAVNDKGEGTSLDNIYEHRVYFAGGRMIRHLHKELEMKGTDNKQALLKAAPNKPHEDEWLVENILKNARPLVEAKTPADLGDILTQEEGPN